MCEPFAMSPRHPATRAKSAAAMARGDSPPGNLIRLMEARCIQSGAWASPKTSQLLDDPKTTNDLARRARAGFGAQVTP